MTVLCAQGTSRFLYLQAEPISPFEVIYAGTVKAASPTGYLILPGLPVASVEFVVRQQGARSYRVDLTQGDKGLGIRKKPEDWYLVDLKTGQVVDCRQCGSACRRLGSFFFCPPPIESGSGYYLIIQSSGRSGFDEPGAGSKVNCSGHDPSGGGKGVGSGSSTSQPGKRRYGRGAGSGQGGHAFHSFAPGFGAFWYLERHLSGGSRGAGGYSSGSGGFHGTVKASGYGVETGGH
jgi:hypothetical protein